MKETNQETIQEGIFKSQNGHDTFCVRLNAETIKFLDCLKRQNLKVKP